MTALTRREFLKVSGSVAAATGTGGIAGLAQAADSSAAYASPPPEALSTWLQIQPDGQVLAFFGKMDVGLGLDTAIAQIVAEELNLPAERVQVVMGDTLLTPNQGGASASSSIRWGAQALRNAAAEARGALIAEGARRLGVAPADVLFHDGIVMVANNPSQGIRIEHIFDKNVPGKLEWNKQQGNGMRVKGSEAPKPVAGYRVVGQPVARKDMHGKIVDTSGYLTNVRLPGMVHARTVRPAVAGAVPVRVDESSIKSIPGARVVWKKDFLAVVAPQEWHAIKAAQALKVEWSTPPQALTGNDGLHAHIRQAPAVASNGGNATRGKKAYDPKPTLAALAASARVVEAEYETPFQSHARMAPSIGVADVREDSAVIYVDSQKPHFVRDGIALLLGYPADKVRVIWRHGAGSYGRSDADEAAFEAAVISKEIGKPVRVQWMRDEGIAWDPKAPASVLTLKAGLDADNKVSAYFFRAKGFSGWDVKFLPDTPEQTLVGMQLGHKKWDAHNFDTPDESYRFPNTVAYWETIAPFIEKASPLRSAHMRAPQELQTRFANESFIDELALAAGQDPLQFRLAHLEDPREIDVLKAAAKQAGWTPGQAPQPSRQDGKLAGRGISLYSGYDSHVAVIADVEVDPQSGRIWVKHVTVAHDCGLVINPKTLHNVIEGSVVMGISRVLFEEVQFDKNGVTSVDWATYPILDIKDAPQKIDVVLVNRPDKPAGGAGEPTHVAIPAAVANAFANATGRRLRRYPMTAERVKEVLKA
ncbi:MAG: molybdopterin-dependent oxidoreductase [Pigmentiphaga sp.]|uniref:molybdopterin cofactor-binding domain-containing protein n=1 Tax=Pigmentiphaga sp. TaxID=1977564 RepID=UPI0029B449E9|nr:molybdopterin cofactor-binding domain-containing protein [Pigmentiphaga sp.]MDX3904172.1 molybdopterin-dependent oxidoreductase [Pigmentiphaga sp.]